MSRPVNPIAMRELLPEELTRAAQLVARAMRDNPTNVRSMNGLAAVAYGTRAPRRPNRALSKITAFVTVRNGLKRAGCYRLSLATPRAGWPNDIFWMRALSSEPIGGLPSVVNLPRLIVSSIQ